MNSKKILTLGLAALFAGLASTASAAFVLIDDFNRADSDTLGNSALSSGGSPVAWAETGDPADHTISGNRLLSGGGFADLNLDLTGTGVSIAEGNTGTFFLQVTIVDDVARDESGAVGLGGRAGDNVADDMTSRLTVFDSGADSVGGELQAESGGSAQTATSGTTYNIWMVNDTSADTTDYYWSTGAGAATSIGSGLAYSGSNASSSTGIQSIVFEAFNDNDGAEVFYDNLYLDASGQNLANPVVIPEPSAFALMAGALGLGLVILRRRR